MTISEHKDLVTNTEGGLKIQFFMDIIFEPLLSTFLIYNFLFKLGKRVCHLKVSFNGAINVSTQKKVF